MKENNVYDVCVVGGGHAGVEAALASARMGCSTVLLTMNLDSVGQMSCNPSIGGIGKGHLVREIDALGGEMGKLADETGINFRMLNTKKGPAVRAPRAQCNKKRYQLLAKSVLEAQDCLDIRQAVITGIRRQEEKKWNVSTNLGVDYQSSVVVLTTGTFLRGLMHMGDSKIAGGRMGDGSSVDLADSLMESGVELCRLKTGTPPRLHRRSINWAVCELQPGDIPISFFSHSPTAKFHVEQMPCFLTYTSSKTSKVICENLHRSPMYSGEIIGIGPRYCPSIEDKITRYKEKERHQIFLEPEGVNTDEIYVNGASTSMPYEVQVEIIHSIVGLEKAELLRPAYAVEYDFAPPTQLHPWLESKKLSDLFFAGQINGTSGYEEAAAQGIMAGVNAALKVKGKAPFVLKRSDAYIGVLIDDLITKGAPEPYRMFTSRAEYRLSLRQDNADLRLTRLGYNLGLASLASLIRVESKERQIADILDRLDRLKSEGKSLSDFLRRPNSRLCDLGGEFCQIDPCVAEQVEIWLKYDGYLKREAIEVNRLNSMEGTIIPHSLDYDLICGLRTEARQKLKSHIPYTIGQASRISGVTASDIAVLSIWIRKSG